VFKGKSATFRNPEEEYEIENDFPRQFSKDE
jgi:hypothetical protein